jgi:hypothetical protein
VATNPHAIIDHGTSRTGRWLRERRLRVALWIAVVEGIVVAVTSDLTKWTVLVVAIAMLTMYALVGRDSQSDAFRQVAWILAASQVLALIVVIFAIVIKWLAVVAIVAFAIAALLYLFSDRR